MSTTTSTIPRRNHTELQPLVTSHHSVHGDAGSASYTLSSVLTNMSLPSPSVAAARAYYLERSPPIGQNFNALQRRRRLIEGQEFPRRHSALPMPDSESNVKLEQAEDVSMSEVKQNDLVKVTAVATAERTDGTAPASHFLQQVPFQYTHDRLRDWGFAYLGNTATADAFINAESLRRPSLQLVKEDIMGDRPEQTGLVTIRALILPKTKERKPFVIQKKLDIEKLRASIPGVERPASTLPRRSNRARRSSAQISSTSLRRRTSESPRENMSLLGKGAIPIHIEYALHYLPVLAAVMLSGHVRKGDSINLPVPHPQAWRDMISYIYTGKGEMTVGVKENILYLAGNAG